MLAAAVGEGSAPGKPDCAVRPQPVRRNPFRTRRDRSTRVGADRVGERPGRSRRCGPSRARAPRCPVRSARHPSRRRRRRLHGCATLGTSFAQHRLKLDEMLRALKILASGPGLVAITLAELNPHNAAANDGLLERFAASWATRSAMSAQRALLVAMARHVDHIAVVADLDRCLSRETPRSTAQGARMRPGRQPDARREARGSGGHGGSSSSTSCCRAPRR
jgi:hypothetical protein